MTDYKTAFETLASAARDLMELVDTGSWEDAGYHVKASELYDASAAVERALDQAPAAAEPDEGCCETCDAGDSPCDKQPWLGTTADYAQHYQNHPEWVYCMSVVGELMGRDGDPLLATGTRSMWAGLVMRERANAVDNARLAAMHALAKGQDPDAAEWEHCKRVAKQVVRFLDESPDVEYDWASRLLTERADATKRATEAERRRVLAQSPAFECSSCAAWRERIASGEPVK
jgi:hypothetical protein